MLVHVVICDNWYLAWKSTNLVYEVAYLVYIISGVHYWICTYLRFFNLFYYTKTHIAQGSVYYMWYMSMWTSVNREFAFCINDSIHAHAYLCLGAKVHVSHANIYLCQKLCNACMSLSGKLYFCFVQTWWTLQDIYIYIRMLWIIYLQFKCYESS